MCLFTLAQGFSSHSTVATMPPPTHPHTHPHTHPFLRSLIAAQSSNASCSCCHCLLGFAWRPEPPRRGAGGEAARAALQSAFSAFTYTPPPPRSTCPSIGHGDAVKTASCLTVLTHFLLHDGFQGVVFKFVTVELLIISYITE